jgi:hypothetical protein
VNSTATFFFGGFLLLIAAAAASALTSAITCAEDGYEDALGFHYIGSEVAAGVS